MTSEVLNAQLKGGDFVIHVESPIVCYESSKITNAAQVTDLQQIAGYPLTGVAAGTPALALVAGVLNVDGFLVQGRAISALGSAAVTDEFYQIIARGPGAVNSALFPADDIAGTPWVGGTLATQAEGIGLVVRDEPAETSVQES